ncbi:hypothetical protein [Flavitalea sp.]|nr:hypothetical protein [Flavitalea sp.]
MKTSVAFLFLISVFAVSCGKSGSDAGKLVEIYRFKTTRGPGPCKIDRSRAELADTPFITNDAIRSYNKKEFEFLISDEASKKTNSLIDNEALAITVDKEVIYYCVHKPIYSSSTCGDEISMDNSSRNKIRMYILNINPANPVPDQRNDSRLINALAAQRKLK